MLGSLCCPSQQGDVCPSAPAAALHNQTTACSLWQHKCQNPTAKEAQRQKESGPHATVKLPSGLPLPFVMEWMLSCSLGWLKRGKLRGVLPIRRAPAAELGWPGDPLASTGKPKDHKGWKGPLRSFSLTALGAPWFGSTAVNGWLCASCLGTAFCAIISGLANMSAKQPLLHPKKRQKIQSL